MPASALKRLRYSSHPPLAIVCESILRFFCVETAAANRPSRWAEKSAGGEARRQREIVNLKKKPYFSGNHLSLTGSD
jgi:hypothetical protein